MWAVIPIKDLTNAKQRLAEALDPSERRRLFRCMFEDVLATVSRVRRLAGVMVVTRDSAAAEIAKARRARVLREDHNRGQSAAVGHAAAVLAGEGVASMLTLPGDVPLVTEEEIAAILDAHGAAPALSIVPARDDSADTAANHLLADPDRSGVGLGLVHAPALIGIER